MDHEPGCSHDERIITPRLTPCYSIGRQIGVDTSGFIMVDMQCKTCGARWNDITRSWSKGITPNNASIEF